MKLSIAVVGLFELEEDHAANLVQPRVAGSGLDQRIEIGQRRVEFLLADVETPPGCAGPQIVGLELKRLVKSASCFFGSSRIIARIDERRRGQGRLIGLVDQRDGLIGGLEGLCLVAAGSGLSLAIIRLGRAGLRIASDDFFQIQQGHVAQSLRTRIRRRFEVEDGLVRTVPRCSSVLV